MKKTLVAAALLLTASLAGVRAQSVPNYLNYQGYLTGQDGTPLPSELYILEFNLYTAPDAVNPVWGPIVFDGATVTGHKSKAQVALGRFNVILGPVDTADRPIKDAFVGATTNLFVGIKVNAGAEILPRQQVLTAPFSFASVVAQNLGTDRLTTNLDGGDRNLYVGGGDIKMSGLGALNLDSGNIIMAGGDIAMGNAGDIYLSQGGRLNFGDGTYLETDPGPAITKLNEALSVPPLGTFPSPALNLDATGKLTIAGGLTVGTAYPQYITFEYFGSATPIANIQGYENGTPGELGLNGNGGVTFIGKGGFSGSQMIVRDSNDQPGITTAAYRDSGYVYSITNGSDTNDGDVLQIITGSGPTPGVANNLIGFASLSAATTLGAIQGNGAGSVAYVGSGNDYAEWMPRLDVNEKLERGDVVGVADGKISSRTAPGLKPMVISSSPIVIGNQPGDEKLVPSGNIVAFIGQAPVKVSGPAHSGDYLVPSGKNDGAAVAIPADKLVAAQVPQVIGRAWETSEQDGMHKVNAIIGMSASDDVVIGIADEVGALRAKLTGTEARVANLEAQVGELQNLKAQLASMQDAMRGLIKQQSPAAKLTSGGE